VEVVGGPGRVVVVHAGAVVDVVGAAHADAAVERSGSAAGAVDLHRGASGARLVEVAQLVVHAGHRPRVRHRAVLGRRLPSLGTAQTQPLPKLAFELFLQHMSTESGTWENVIPILDGFNFDRLFFKRSKGKNSG